MRRIIVVAVLFSIVILAAWVIFDAFAASAPEAKSDNSQLQVQAETDEIPNANQSVDLPVPVAGRNMKIAPVFDSTGAVTSDPTGTLLNVTNSGARAVPATVTDMKISPVFDSTGAVASDPTGTLLNTNNSGGKTAPVTGRDMKIAPAFDSTGTITSDPTGTILSAIIP
jgi:hypothetical protein